MRSRGQLTDASVAYTCANEKHFFSPGSKRRGQKMHQRFQGPGVFPDDDAVDVNVLDTRTVAVHVFREI